MHLSAAVTAVLVIRAWTYNTYGDTISAVSLRLRGSDAIHHINSLVCPAILRKCLEQPYV
eukprot:5380821-Amphidinium_carterae.1